MSWSRLCPLTSLHLSTGLVRTSTLSENLEKWSRNVVFPQPIFPSTTTVKGLVSFILNGLSPPSDFTRVLKRPMLGLFNRRFSPGRVYQLRSSVRWTSLILNNIGSCRLSSLLPSRSHSPARPTPAMLVCNARVGRSLSHSQVKFSRLNMLTVATICANFQAVDKRYINI